MPSYAERWSNRASEGYRPPAESLPDSPRFERNADIDAGAKHASNSFASNATITRPARDTTSDSHAVRNTLSVYALMIGTIT